MSNSNVKCNVNSTQKSTLRLMQLPFCQLSWGSHYSPVTMLSSAACTQTSLAQASNKLICLKLFLPPRVVQERARICLMYLVNQLANMEHSFHHILLLEIKSLTDTFSGILGTQSRDIYRMSNSFTAIAKLLVRQLENDNTSGAR